MMRPKIPTPVSVDQGDAADTSETIPMNSLELIKQLGEGSYALVWKAKYTTPTSTIPVAIKVFNESCFESFEKEKETLTTIKQKTGGGSHPQIISFLGHGIYYPKGRSPEQYLVLEFMRRGSLESFLGDKAEHLSTFEKLMIAHRAASGIAYLHSLNIIHRDIKAANLLIGPNLTVKIADFHTANSEKSVGTPLWEPPEVLRKEIVKPIPAIDVYSLGVTLIELFNYQAILKLIDIPFHKWLSVSSAQIEEVIQDMTLPSDCSSQEFESIKQLIRDCVTPDLYKRPTMDAIVQRLSRMMSSKQATPLRLNTVTLAMDDNAKAEATASLNHVVGWNSVATVWKATYKLTSVAIKFLDANASPGDCKAFNSQLTILKTLNEKAKHTNILTVYGSGKAKVLDSRGEPLFIMMEFAGKTSLAKVLKKEELTWNEMLKIAKGIASGLQFLHQNGVPHGAIDCDHVLVDDKYVAKLGVKGRYDNQSIVADIFAFGLLLVELFDKDAFDRYLTREKKYHTTHNVEKTLDHMDTPQGCTSDQFDNIKKLIRSCFNESYKRPKAEDLVKQLDIFKTTINLTPVKTPIVAAGKFKTEPTIPLSRDSRGDNLFECVIS